MRLRIEVDFAEGGGLSKTTDEFALHTEALDHYKALYPDATRVGVERLPDAVEDEDANMPWTVVVVEAPGEERVAGRWPTREGADHQAQAIRRIERQGVPSGAPFPKVLVEKDGRPY